MRKLAPVFITTSLLALAGTAFANTGDINTTDKNGQPSVSDNTNKQPLSYSDKSNTAKGTNAKMDDKSIAPSAGTTLNDTTRSYTAGEDKQEMRDESKNYDAAKAKHPKHAKAKHVKKHKTTTASREDATSTMPNANTSTSSDNPPASATKGEVANSATGKSAGQ